MKVSIDDKNKLTNLRNFTASHDVYNSCGKAWLANTRIKKPFSRTKRKSFVSIHSFTLSLSNSATPHLQNGSKS